MLLSVSITLHSDRWSSFYSWYHFAQFSMIIWDCYRNYIYTTVVFQVIFRKQIVWSYTSPVVNANGLHFKVNNPGCWAVTTTHYY